MDPLASIKSSQIRDADTLGRELSDWRIDSIQLGQGQFQLQSDRLVYPDLVVERSHHNLAKKDVYYLPPNTTNLCLIKPGAQPGHWCGFEVPENSLLVNHSGREHFVVLPPGYEHIAISFDNTLISAWDLLPSRFSEDSAASKRSILPLSEPHGTQFRHWLFGCFVPDTYVQLTQDRNASARFRERLRSGVTRLIDEALVMQGEVPCRIRNKQRFPIVYRACDLVGEKIHDTMTGASLAMELGVNARALQRAFADVIGMSPQRYIQISKLRSVRRVLRDTPRWQTTVSAVAIQHGFTELGRFSIRYRQMFGESPSETLTGGSRIIPVNG